MKGVLVPHDLGTVSLMGEDSEIPDKHFVNWVFYISWHYNFQKYQQHSSCSLPDANKYFVI